MPGKKWDQICVIHSCLLPAAGADFASIHFHKHIQVVATSGEDSFSWK
jgi:hypothetical protein